jgi:hypothetical protein
LFPFSALCAEKREHEEIKYRMFMLAMVGAVGLGLVWGWLAVRLCRRARWPLVARVLLWLAVQALVVVWLASFRALLAFAAAALLSALLCAAWLRALALRYSDTEA